MKQYLFIACLLFSAGVYSQNNNSPYSIVGIGDIENSFYNRTSGLANTGVAYRNDRYMINNNPASYTALQQQFFNIEMAGNAQFITYFGTPVSALANSSKDFAIKRLSIGTKITKRWSSGLGISPFSTSNYGFSAQKPIQGSSILLPATYDGNGSINQAYWNNAYEVTKHFSVGIMTSYLFGSLNQTENLFTADLATSLTTTRQIYLSNFYFNYGAQYYAPISKHLDLTVGATYANKTNLSAEYGVTVTDNTGQVLNNQITKNTFFELPDSYAGGITLAKDKKYIWTADYKHQAWTNTNVVGSGFSLQNSNRISGGFEKVNRKQIYNNNFEKSYIQFGAYYGTSYLDISGIQLQEAGVTFGYGFTSLKTPLAGHIVFELGQRGTEKNSLVKELFFNIGFTASYRDFWLTKGRKYF